MLTQCWASHGASSLSTHSFLSPKTLTRAGVSRNPKKPFSSICILKDGYAFESIAEIASNKVLIAAGVSAAVGQLSKPFTSVLLYGKGFDFRTAFQAGGFPSTHSSTVVAAATSLALERGFSDSIFGLSLVYAGLVMYDAQGVRREVGNHARVLNERLSSTQINTRKERSLETTPSSKERTSYLSEKTEGAQLKGSDVVNEVKLRSRMVVPTGLDSQVEEVASRDHCRESKVVVGTPLKESIGHTEVEVLSGALLGFFVSLAVYTIL